MDLNTPVSEIIDESFSAASYMDVSELRLLYHGRIDLFVTFTDDGRSTDEPNSSEVRPAGLICHAINDVVGRKIQSSTFYGNVFRINKTYKSRKFLADVRQYDSSDLKQDIESLYTLSYLEHEDIDSVVNKVSVQSRIRTMFHRFWEITRKIANARGGRYASKYWRRILFDLGYNGFNDPHGTGILIKQKKPVCLWLDKDGINEIDIVPIQKFRKDPRRRIANQVSRDVRRMATRRHQIAKKRFTDRSDKPSADNTFDILGKLFLL